MTWLLRIVLWLRHVLRLQDGPSAVRLLRAADAERVRRAEAMADAPAVSMAASRRSEPVICLGNALRADGSAYPVCLPERTVRGGGHWMFEGATGAGKSYLVLGIALQLLRRLGSRLVIIDMKGELAGLLRTTFLPALVASLPDRDAEVLAGRIAVIAPFDESATPPFQLLARDPALSIEVQAREVAMSFGRTIGADLGVIQQHTLLNALMLAIDVGLTLPDLPLLLQDEALLRGALSRTKLESVKAYFSGRFQRERAGSLLGLISRLESVVMYPSLRRMLIAPGMVQFDKLLERCVTVIDLGGAPAGMNDLSRFFGQVMFGKLVRAIFSRRVTPTTPPVTIIADEFQQLLMPEVARDFERVLTLARSQKVFLWALFQQAAQVEAASSGLLRILRTNTNYQILMRSELDDARRLAHVLPTTGEAFREETGPVDPRHPPQLLTRDEERRQLLELVPSLPDRMFWFWARRESYPAILTRSARVDVGRAESVARKLPKELRAALANGILAIPPREIEQAEARRASTRKAMAGGGAADSGSVRGRGRRQRADRDPLAPVKEPESPANAPDGAEAGERGRVELG